MYSDQYLKKTNTVEYYFNRMLNMYGKDVPFKHSNLCYLIRYQLGIYK